MIYVNHFTELSVLMLGSANMLRLPFGLKNLPFVHFAFIRVTKWTGSELSVSFRNMYVERGSEPVWFRMQCDKPSHAKTLTTPWASCRTACVTFTSPNTHKQTPCSPTTTNNNELLYNLVSEAVATFLGLQF